MDEGSKQTTDLVKNWVNASKRVSETSEALGKAIQAEEEAKHALAEFILPDDARINETIAVWVNVEGIFPGKTELMLSARKTTLISPDELVYSLEWREKTK